MPPQSKKEPTPLRASQRKSKRPKTPAPTADVTQRQPQPQSLPTPAVAKPSTQSQETQEESQTPVDSAHTRLSGPRAHRSPPLTQTPRTPTATTPGLPAT